MLGSLTLVFVFAHWEACLMMLVASFTDNPANTCLGVNHYCVRARDNSSDGSGLVDGVYCKATGELYLASATGDLYATSLLRRFT
eukprot:7230474-Prymnesium_polylepis.1